MKLFIDTSNKKIILAIIDKEDVIVDFFIEDTNNDVVKNCVFLIKKFLAKNNIKINDLNEYMLTIGPGSFTGVKVGLNIVRSFNLVNLVKKIYVIDTFTLLKEDNMDFTVIPFGKKKFYLKQNSKKKIEIVDYEKFIQLKNVTIGYDNFNKDSLKKKIDNKSFKLLDNLDKVKIKYLSKF